MSWKKLFIVDNVYGVSRASLMVGEFRSKALSALLEEETILSEVRCCSDRLPCCLTVAIHTSGMSIDG